MANVSELLSYLENIAPFSYQESYDNAGLIVGDRHTEIKGVLTTLDCTEEVLDEAIAKKCNVILAHHPIIFKGLKTLQGKNYVERVVIKAIKNDLIIIGYHTNLDNVSTGVNAEIARRIGLENLKILSPKKGILKKLFFYVPVQHTSEVCDAVFAAGAGEIGEYSECSFKVSGEGTFKANENAEPFVGENGKRHYEKENKVEVIFPAHAEGRVLSALKEAHPYEEVAYDIVALENSFDTVGAGMIGELAEKMPFSAFLAHLKKQMKTELIRYTNSKHEYVKRIAICGGAGSFLLSSAKRAGAEVFVTGDFKYHEFFDGDNDISIADIGHFESEQFTRELLQDIVKRKFPTFAVHFSEVNTNPINYFK